LRRGVLLDTVTVEHVGAVVRLCDDLRASDKKQTAAGGQQRERALVLPE